MQVAGSFRDDRNSLHPRGWPSSWRLANFFTTCVLALACTSIHSSRGNECARKEQGATRGTNEPEHSIRTHMDSTPEFPPLTTKQVVQDMTSELPVSRDMTLPRHGAKPRLVGNAEEPLRSSLPEPMLDSSVRNVSSSRASRRKLQEVTSLQQPISSGDLEELDLAAHQQPGDLSDGNTVQILGCKGDVCPQFSACKSTGIRTCHIPLLQDDGQPGKPSGEGPAAVACPKPGDLSAGQVFYPNCKLAEGDWLAAKWIGQMVVLKNVFLNSDGEIFNASHRFYPGGCIHDSLLHPKFSYGGDTKVLQFHRVVNLAIGPHGKHRVFEMLERLPLFLTMAPMLQSLAGEARFFLGESKLLSPVIGHVLGANPRKHAIHMPTDDQLIFAKVLYQPVHQACTLASPSVWSILRQALLLPRSNLPMFNGDWVLRHPLPEAFPAAAQELQTLPDNWAVVLAKAPSCLPLSLKDDTEGAYNTALSPEALVQNNFWFGHVEPFTWATDVQATKELFNRAALLITTPGAAMANMAFMPTGGVVILLDQARPMAKGLFVTNSGMSAQFRSFAEACGLAVATVLCELDGVHKGSLLCSRKQLTAALDWAAALLYNSPLLPGSESRRSVFKRIPGSGLETSEEVELYKKWAACASQRGKWTYDPAPRPLAWPYHGSLERCDRNHIDAVEGGMGGRMADDLARGKSPDASSWRVREGLKYRWEVSPVDCQDSVVSRGGVYQRYNRREFCKLGGKTLRILLLGDSIQTQLVEALAQNMLLGLGKPVRKTRFYFELTKECTEWLAGANVPHLYCLLGLFGKDDVCPGLTLDYIRNDLMEIYYDGAPVFDRMPWAQVLRPHIDAADVIIFNRGPHFTPMTQFETEMQGISRFLRFNFPNKLIIYRNTPPGHLNCTAYSRPLKERQDPSGLPYNWDKFGAQNARAKEIVEALGIVYMDVDGMTGLRADGHKGFWPELNLMDCLHYCHPGPIDSWVELLFNMLRQLRLDTVQKT